MGRIDVHAHLLPAVDDGSRNVAESIEMAKLMVAAGYSDQFCTPHIWPNLSNEPVTIAEGVAKMQTILDAAAVPLRLRPGGEMNLTPGMEDLPIEAIVTYDNAGRYALFDFWSDEYPANFWPFVERLRSFGIQPILAHPERINAVQNDPHSIDEFPSRGLLIQCNLECLGEEKVTVRRTLAERWLADGEYFMLGSDMHRTETLPRRLNGLKRATDIVGPAEVNRLTIDNPSMLIG